VLARFETSAEKAFFLSLCAAVVLGVVVAVASVRTQIGVASPGFVVWQNLIVPAIGAIGPSPEAAAVPQRTIVTSVDGVPVRDATQLRARVRSAPPGSFLREPLPGGAHSSCSDSREGASHGSRETSRCGWRRSSR
jgi:hypothetical protein